MINLNLLQHKYKQTVKVWHIYGREQGGILLLFLLENNIWNATL